MVRKLTQAEMDTAQLGIPTRVVGVVLRHCCLWMAGLGGRWICGLACFGALRAPPACERGLVIPVLRDETPGLGDGRSHLPLVDDRRCYCGVCSVQHASGAIARALSCMGDSCGGAKLSTPAVEWPAWFNDVTDCLRRT